MENGTVGNGQILHHLAKTEGKNPALAAYEGSEYTAGAVQPPVTKAGTAEADRKAGYARTEGYRMQVLCLIKQFEGCRLEAYRGPHQLDMGIRPACPWGMKITRHRQRHI